MSGENGDHWEELTVIGGLVPAQLFKTRLESAGIPVLLNYESAARLFGLTLNGLGKIRVMVPQSRRAEAEAVLAEPALDPAGEGESSPAED
jgi:hypothetical protein